MIRKYFYNETAVLNQHLFCLMTIHDIVIPVTV